MPQSPPTPPVKAPAPGDSVRVAARRLGLALLVLLLGLYVMDVPLLDVIELKTYDMRLHLTPPANPEPAVAIVAIDEKSLAAQGRWPWSRATMARLVARLDALGARVIAFDVFFSEPENRAALEQLARLERDQGYSETASPYARVKRALAADSEFGRAIARSNKVVLPMVFLMNDEEARDQNPAGARRVLASVENQAVKIIRDRGDGGLAFPLPPTTGLIANLPELAQAARASGHINSLPDRDGSVRWAPLVLRHQGLFFPSADVQAVRLYLGMPELILHTASWGIRGVQIGERYFDTDEYGRALIRYRGAVRSFPTVSATDILAGHEDGAHMRGKIVLIGATAAGMGDMRVTPFGAVFPGIEIRANIIQNLLDGDFVHRPGWMFALDIVVMLVLGSLLVLLLPRLGPRASSALALGLGAAYLLAALLEFRFELLWVNLVYPLLLLSLLFMSSTVLRYVSADREKRQIKNAFQHYVPATVVDQVMRNVDNLRLGGEKRELTVLFSDIRGFTALAERLPPEQLVHLLNDYLTRMTDQVFRHQGLLDKYIGDAIMAVYGAPLPQADHAQRACRTALDMLREAQRLQAESQGKGLPPLDLGIGINTGPMVVGNMGSKTLFDYTVIGDAVNLGARIEALNRTYGTHILISEFTWQQVKDEFPHAREIDITAVRGRKEPVRLYELMLPERYPHMDWLKEYARAYDLFRAGLLARARPVFQQLADDLGDPVSRYYAERCQTPRRRRND